MNNVPKNPSHDYQENMAHENMADTAENATQKAQSNFSEFEAVNDLIANFINALKLPAQDIEKNVKALLAESITRMDLVSQAEMQRQTMLLKSAMQKLSELEAKLENLENLKA